MGWNSWNTFYDQVSEELICSTADAIADKGLAKAGYEYVIIDDWSSSMTVGAGGQETRRVSSYRIRTSSRTGSRLSRIMSTRAG